MKKILSIMTVAVLSLGILAGCSSSSSESYESGQLSAVYQSVLTELYGDNAPGFVEATDAMTIEGLTGVTEDLYKEGLLAMPLMNINVDTFIGFEVEDGQTDGVKSALEDYKARIIADREAFPYLPDHLPKAKAAQVVVYGNYVFYISMADIALDVTEADIQDAADAGVESVIATIENTLK